ncbi:MAG: IS110 family transposase [Dehalococcoidia bacterium]
MEEAYELYAGLDWGSRSHQACVLDHAGNVVDERAVEHSGSGIAELAQWLQGLCDGDSTKLAVAIEIPHGALVDTLVEQRFAVYSLNPKQLERFRGRHSVAGAKDDRRDAHVLANSLRTDQAAFQRVEGDDPSTLELRELSRTAEELKDELNRLSNKLWALLSRSWPGLLGLCPGANKPWLWRLLEVAQTPERAAHLQRGSLERLLKEARVTKVKADELQDVLRQPPLRLAPGAGKAVSEHIALLLPRLQLTYRQKRECEKRIEELLAAAQATVGGRGEHRDVEVLCSFPGVGVGTAATMLAEASRPLAQANYRALRAQAGVAPVTHQSGVKLKTSMRYACNPRLRNAVWYWALAAIRLDARSSQRYAALRQKGRSHGSALRCVADRLLYVLCVALRNGTTWDPARYQPQLAKIA